MPAAEPLPAVTILMLGGMGADPLFVAPQKRAFRDAAVTPAWPPHRPGETVRDYAHRWAADIRPSIPPDRPLLIVGVSFGGMVAQEMALALGAAGVVLVSSARSGDSLAPLYRFLEWLVRPVPWRIAQPLAGAIGYLHGLQMKLGPAHRRVVARVAARMDLRLTQWCAYGAGHWPGVPPDRRPLLPPIRHIHGDRDPLVPPERLATPATVLIPGGSHMIHLSHAEDVNRFILACCLDLPTKPQLT